ncbi:MAG: FecR domain-containing protein [Bordetella sp.]|uniref:FecR domain-containing protein n=1 Tax=Bordetella sp. TaxID=28081 RepID=UPI003F7B8516
MLLRFGCTRPPPGGGPRLDRRHILGSLLALSGAAAGVSIANAYYPLAGLSDDMATATGERRLHRLPDGSRLLLNARTRVDLSFTAQARALHLREGALSLTAQPDAARPFVIHTNEGIVRPAGARVMVRQQMRRTLVVAPDSAVEIATANGARATLPAGTGTRFDSIVIGDPRPDLLADAAWETGWIDVHDRPLLEVVDALRPYRKGPLSISAAAGGLLANGRYPLDDSDAALRALQSDMPIRIHRIARWYTSIDLAPAGARNLAGRYARPRAPGDPA